MAVGQSPRLLPLPHNRYPGDDIGSANDRRLDRFEMMMEGQYRSVWLLYQRESVVTKTFRKGTVYGNGFSAPFQRRLPLFDLNRNMSVHNQTLIRFDAEFGCAA